MSDIKHTKERIQLYIENESWDKIASFLNELHPADIAEIINQSPEGVQNNLFELVDKEIKPDVMTALDHQAELDVLEELTDEEISDIVEEMAPDDAADLLGDLEDEQREEILELMEQEDSEEVRELLQYDEDTAGGIMTTDFIAVNAEMTAEQALAYIGSLEIDEAVYFVYVVTSEGKMKGYIQLWELLKKNNYHKTLSELVVKDTISVNTETDQEDVARIASKYDLSSLPVLNSEDILVGRITVDDILDVIEEEASEDIFKFAGSNESELEYHSPIYACKARLPWLMITLIAGLISTIILKQFMIKFENIIMLSFFVPVIMAMAGNTGIQSSTLIVRSLALGTINEKGVSKLLYRELTAGALMGLISGILAGIWSSFIGGNDSMIPSSYLAITVGISLFSAMMFAAVFGAFAPLFLNKIKADPAVASGPFVTASNDILALLIYYGVAIGLIFFYAY